MVSHSNPRINMAFCLAVVITAASGVRAQLSNVPVRRRHNNEHREFGRQPKQHRQGRQPPQRHRSNLEVLDGDLSVPAPLEEMMSSSLKTSDSELSMPTQVTSFPLEQLSMPLEEHGFNLSMPGEESPFPIAWGEAAVVVLEKGGSSPLLLASFLAGISALVIGAVALFAKTRRKTIREFNESQEDREERQMPAGPVSSNISMVPFVDSSDDLDQLVDVDII